jgi:hypothetical protein
MGARKPKSSSARRVGQADRTFVKAPVTLNADHGGVEGVVCDVSEHGFKIQLDKPPELGPVTVKLVGLPIVSGEICWRAAGRIGVRLARPFSPEVLADWIHHHGGGR